MLDDFPLAFQKRISGYAFRKFARDIARDAKANLRREIKSIKSFRIRPVPRRGYVKRRRVTGINAAVLATTLSGSGKGILWFEKGTDERIQLKTGRRTGRLPAYRFLIKALEKNAPSAIPRITKYANEKYISEMRKLAKKHKLPFK